MTAFYHSLILTVESKRLSVIAEHPCKILQLALQRQVDTPSILVSIFLKPNSVLWRRDLSSFKWLSSGHWRREQPSGEHSAPPWLLVSQDSADCQLAQIFQAVEHRRVPVPSDRRHAGCRVAGPRGGWCRAALALPSVTPPCDKCFCFALTRTKCCHCYVKHSLGAFCRRAVRSHSAVALNLHAFPRWPNCAQKEKADFIFDAQWTCIFAGRKLDVFLRLHFDSDQFLLCWNKSQELLVM